MTLSVDQAKAIIEEFCRQYAVASTVPYRVRATQQEAFQNERLTPENVGTLYGAYFPGQRYVAIAAAQHGDASSLEETLRHEVLGHFGLNTLSAWEKHAVLDAIVASRHQPDIAPLWQEATRICQLTDPLRVAEEVYCRVCEFIEPNDRHDNAVGLQALRQIVSQPTKIELSQLATIASHVSQGLRDGTRALQIIPVTDEGQFRKVGQMNETDLRADRASRTAKIAAIMSGAGQPIRQKTDKEGDYGLSM